MKFCMDVMPRVNYPNSKYKIPTLSITNVTGAWIREVEGWWNRN
jgi:hypothetical protein